MTIVNNSARSLRICHLNAQPHMVHSGQWDLEKKLSFLAPLSIETVAKLDDPRLLPCDLLVVAAQKIPKERFHSWLEDFSQRLIKQGHIWLPALIVAQASFADLQALWTKAVKMNWYFDIVNEKHLDSLPIRVANLLRIHDHLHELARYETTLSSLSQTIDQLAAELDRLKEAPL